MAKAPKAAAPRWLIRIGVVRKAIPSPAIFAPVPVAVLMTIWRTPTAMLYAPDGSGPCWLAPQDLPNISVTVK